MKSPRFTDSHRFSRPYVGAEASSRPGYLAERFATIRAEQEATAASQWTEEELRALKASKRPALVVNRIKTARKA